MEDIDVNVEQASDVQLKLTVTIPAKVIDQYILKKTQEVQKQAKLKGFRQGMVPIKMVQEKFGQEILQEVAQEVVQESYRTAIRTKQLRVVSVPAVHDKEGNRVHVVAGKSLTYVAVAEVLPKVALKGYKGLSLKKEPVAVTDADLKKVTDQVLESRAQLVPLSETENRASKKGDFVDFTFDGEVKNGTGFVVHEALKGNRVVEIGSNVLVKGFEDELVGMKKTDSKEFVLTLPQDLPSQDLAGKEAKFRVTLQEIKEKKVPELTEEFAKELGYVDLGDFNTKVREGVERHKKQESENKLRESLLEELIKKNPVAVPQSLIQAQTREIVEDLVYRLKSQQFTDQMIHQTLESEDKNIQTRAEMKVRAGILLDAVADAEKIEVNDQEVDSEIEKMASNAQGGLVEVQRHFNSNPDRRRDLKYQMRESKTVAWLLEQAKFKS